MEVNILQNKTLRLKPLILQLIFSQGIGTLIIYFIHNYLDIYLVYPKPWYAPPLLIILLIWGIFFILMGMSAYLIICSPIADISTSMYCYLSCHVLILCWSLFFFKFQMLKISMFFMILLVFDFLIATIQFFDIDPTAGLLMAPALIWNIYFAIINGKIITLQQIAAI